MIRAHRADPDRRGHRRRPHAQSDGAGVCGTLGGEAERVAASLVDGPGGGVVLVAAVGRDEGPVGDGLGEPVVVTVEGSNTLGSTAYRDQVQSLVCGLQGTLS